MTYTSNTGKILRWHKSTEVNCTGLSQKIDLKKKMNVLHVIISRMQNEKYFGGKKLRSKCPVIDCIELSMDDKLHITNTLHMIKQWIK